MHQIEAEVLALKPGLEVSELNPLSQSTIIDYSTAVIWDDASSSWVVHHQLFENCTNDTNKGLKGSRAPLLTGIAVKHSGSGWFLVCVAALTRSLSLSPNSLRSDWPIIRLKEDPY